MKGYVLYVESSLNWYIIDIELRQNIDLALFSECNLVMEISCYLFDLNRNDSILSHMKHVIYWSHSNIEYLSLYYRSIVTNFPKKTNIKRTPITFFTLKNSWCAFSMQKRIFLPLYKPCINPRLFEIKVNVKRKKKPIRI